MQPAYTKYLLNKFETDKAKPVAAPTDTNIKVMKAMINVNDICFNQHQYQSAIGSLLYLCVASRFGNVSDIYNINTNATSMTVPDFIQGSCPAMAGPCFREVNEPHSCKEFF